MSDYDDRGLHDWDDDPHAPGNWPRGGSLRAPGVDLRRLVDTPDDPETDPPDQPALTPSQLAATLARVRAGRCTLRAADCAWDRDCVKHWPATEEAAS